MLAIHSAELEGKYELGWAGFEGGCYMYIIFSENVTALRLFLRGHYLGALLLVGWRRRVLDASAIALTTAINTLSLSGLGSSDAFWGEVGQVMRDDLITKITDALSGR